MVNKTSLKLIKSTLAALLALGQACVFAADTKTSTDIETKIISSVKHVENFYNAFGVCYLSTERSKTVTQTTSTTDDGGESKTNTSTTTQESYVVQTWKGGSLKVDYSVSTSTTQGTDGSSSVTNSRVDYVYDDAGRLQSASGTSTTTGTLASDAYGGSGGSYTSTSTTSYIIKNAQALPSETVTDTTTTVEGQVKSTSHEVTTYEYELQRTTVKTYSRDANGVCTGISQTCTGTSVSVDDNGGTWTYTMTNYNAEFKFDDVLGWYLASETYDWELTSDASSSSSDIESAARGVESANDKLLEDSESDSREGSDSSFSGENADSDVRKILPVYNEERQRDMENRILRYNRAAKERQRDSDETVSDFHKKVRQQQAEIEKQIEDFRRANKERRDRINRQIERFERNFGMHFHHFLYK
ncbi:MAG: hypothetical protein MUC52_00450 [Candidatus Omnitrophica bacterium]|nr:hypothetical protein [Candidatus Omnitrophota bacterium]